jgi:hypothetical protein
MLNKFDSKVNHIYPAGFPFMGGWGKNPGILIPLR